MKHNETITISEEVKIPDTNIILEKGDEVEILGKGKVDENVNEILTSLHRIKEVVNQHADVISGDDWKTIRINLEYALKYIREEIR